MSTERILVAVATTVLMTSFACAGVEEEVAQTDDAIVTMPSDREFCAVVNGPTTMPFTGGGAAVATTAKNAENFAKDRAKLAACRAARAAATPGTCPTGCDPEFTLGYCNVVSTTCTSTGTYQDDPLSWRQACEAQNGVGHRWCVGDDHFGDFMKYYAFCTATATGFKQTQCWKDKKKETNEDQRVETQNGEGR